jgi:pSer/pThr/pTyr-binding forkhead associated (FHA) protein
MNRAPAIIVQLVNISGPMKGEIKTFSSGTISIGRNPTCRLRFPPDMTVISRDHAEITREGNQFKLTDKSANGTFVNGKQVSEVYLKNGDILEFSKGGPKISFLTEISDKPLDQEPAVEPPSKSIFREEQQSVTRKKIFPPVREQPEDISDQKSSKTLIIQYGPTIRSFNELPVTVGKNPSSSFRIDDKPSLFDLHAQFFFSQNQYWIKDLTGHKCIQINHQPIGIQAPLTVNDEIALTFQGPVFRYVGEGRLIEVVEPLSEKPSITSPRDKTQAKEHVGLMNKFKKYINDKLK